MIKIIRFFLLLIMLCSHAYADEMLTICAEGLIGTTPYVIEQGKLTYANPDIYLESNGTQYINTGIIPTQNTRIVASIEVTGNAGYNWIFGVINRNTLGKQSCYGLAISGSRFYSEISGTNQSYGYALTYDTIYEFDFTVTKLIAFDNTYETGATTLAQTETQMYLFANNASNGATYDQRFIGRIYYFKVYEDDELIRHFVPVPKGLVIGDFEVPSDGMWDMVEQKFYTNDAGEEFTYGTNICKPCPAHQYYENNACYDCPNGYTDDKTVGKIGISDCKIYCSGGYIANKYDSTCTDAGVGYWAPRSYISYGQTNTPYKCPDNMTSAGFGMVANEIDDCGRILWVNNTPIYIRKTAKTKPSVHINLNNTIYHASATPVDSISDSVDLNSKLYIKLDGKQYIVHDDNLYENHTIKNNELDWVASNLFLESKGEPYIDTDFIPNANTVIKATVMPTGNNGYNWFFGNIDKASLGKQSCFGLAMHNNNCYTEISGSNRDISQMHINTKYNIQFSVPSLYVNNGRADTGASITSYKPASWPMYLFANNAGNGATYDQRFIGRIYDFKIYENDELIRHFVPVPEGLVIGDFTVPSNGMWDMVEQKFYGNIGGGEFTYGMDL